MLNVSRLFCYPVKSVGGYAVDRLEIGHLGPALDRRWVIVDEHGTFLAQRSARGFGVAVPQLCLLSTQVRSDELLLMAPDHVGVEPLRIPLAEAPGPTVPVRIWADVADGIDQGPEAATWLDAVLSRWRPGSYRLVRMPDQGTRHTLDGTAPVGYADGFPLLIASEASLIDLNARIATRRRDLGEEATEPLGWDRFRPNVVIAGAPAYAEDEWASLSAGRVRLDGRTLCRRCPIPTTDQATAVRGHEPLRTLATYRRHPDRALGGVVFARNFVHTGTGLLSVGDHVQAHQSVDVAASTS